MPLRSYLKHHYRHYNAATVIDATEAYEAHIENGGKMMITLAGAMSTAELGLSLAEMIRQDKVHAITCTGANLEEDVFNLVAHDLYHRVPHWRNLTPADEKELERRGLNRVTDTCIPEEEAFRRVERPVLELWREADARGEGHLPHHYLYRLLREGTLAEHYQIDPSDSWLVAAAEKELPLFVPGWEDSTLGNVFVARVLDGTLSGYGAVRSGPEYLAELADWYVQTTMGQSLDEIPRVEAGTGEDPLAGRTVDPADAESTVGFFQIGGGIAGDFPICVVPMIHQDLERRCPYWAYFCQISDSTTSYGSYSGAFPSEKITWGKLDVDTPMFLIESDATIVAPLIFGYLLERDETVRSD